MEMLLLKLRWPDFRASLTHSWCKGKYCHEESTASLTFVIPVVYYFIEKGACKVTRMEIYCILEDNHVSSNILNQCLHILDVHTLFPHGPVFTSIH